jgi:hypothetical protein
MTGPSGNAHSIWAALYIPPPPTEVPCKGVTPALFDIGGDWSHGYNLVESRGNAGRRVTSRFRTQVAVALSYCATCPLATRQWCLDAVAPQTSWYTGVAGGIVWAGGRPVWTIADQERAEAVAS